MASCRSRQSLVEREAESFAQQKSAYARRAKSLQPTLKEFRSKSFTEYVRHALLDTDSSMNNDATNSSSSSRRNHNCEDIRRTRHSDDNKNNNKAHKIEWNHGLVKITLPEGWWDESGISKDRTARGPAWQEGTKLGDLIVEGPIKQHVSGIGGIYEYALVDIPTMTLSKFREKADEYWTQQVNRVLDNDSYNNDDFCDNLANHFWRRLGPTTPPSMYGADMEGSLFGGDDASGWSLAKLDNCLQLLSADQGSTELPGVTTPYLYVGMWGSVFCVHTEDMNLLSINYLHAGAPKYWYAIAPEHAKRFESLAQSHFVHAARDCPEFLRHKQNMLSPTILKKAGVPYEIVIQRPGDAIVTSPGAYHFGVNLGFNIAEATNFGIPEWIPKGREAKVCMCRPNAVRIDVDRFAELLARYEEDMENSRALGLQPLSHRQWTVFQAKRIQATNVSSSSVPKSSKTVIPKDKEFWVEVMQPLNAEGKSLAVSRARGNKRRKKNSLDTEFVEEWRLAKPLDNKKTKLQLEQKVLCLLPGRKEGIDGEVVDEEECFAGVVKEFADDHCRVHFSGLKKDDDVWIALTDPKLFLDGGKWDATAVLEEKPEAAKPSPVKRKNSKRKLALVKPLSAKATKSASKIRSKKQAANAI